MAEEKLAEARAALGAELSANRALLAELREAKAALARSEAGATEFIGPCAHGRDPYDDGEVPVPEAQHGLPEGPRGSARVNWLQRLYRRWPWLECMVYGCRPLYVSGYYLCSRCKGVL